MKFIAIILVVAIIGFAAYKTILKKKTKPTPTKAAPVKTTPSTRGTSTNTTSGGDYYSGKR